MIENVHPLVSRIGACLKVTVAIPVYNREKLIVKTMRSALEQTLSDGWELDLLVIDNASTDETWAAIQSVHDPRIRAIRNPKNLGMFGNFNRCRELAEGRYVRYLCSDDMLAKDCLREEIELMEKNPSASLLNSVGSMIDDQGQVLSHVGDYFPAGLVPGRDAMDQAIVRLARAGGNVFNFPSGLLVRKSAADRAGEFDATLLGLADVDYWMQILSEGDLLNTKNVGCLILEHAGRESYPLFYSGSFIRGQIRVVEEWSAKLGRSEDRIASDRVVLGARCLWYIAKCLMRRRFDGAKVHMDVFREQNYRFLPSFFEVFRQGFGRWVRR